jgi:hypothetical protein
MSDHNPDEPAPSISDQQNDSLNESFHNRLEIQISHYSQLQKEVILDPQIEHQQRLLEIAQALDALCSENIFQVLGEIYLSKLNIYYFTKPLYVTASLIELINRYNRYRPQDSISGDRRLNLICAGLMYNLGLISNRLNLYKERKVLTAGQRNELRKNYPRQSMILAEKIGLNNPVLRDAITQHNVVSPSASFDALILRTPFIYAGIAMPEQAPANSLLINNPSREFARLYANKKLDPMLAGLFLKINGLFPIGSIILFETREKALVIQGPDEDNISSSRIRMLTNKSGIQLNRPGDTLYLHEADLDDINLSDHHQFPWVKFDAFAMWQQ